MTSPTPLSGIQVVDLTTGIAGPYCTKLFVDAGAEVVKVEPPGGDPMRRYAATVDVPAGEDGALFRYLHADKRSIVGAIGDDVVDRLIAGADLLVEDLESTAIDVTALRLRHPHLVIVSITAFGRSGPLAGAPATDLTLQAESGTIMFKGDPLEPPMQAGGRICEFLGGVFAAAPALAAVLDVRRTGHGTHVDVSLHDVMAVAGSNYLSVLHDLLGRPPIDAPARMRDTPGIEQAADGMVGVNANTGQMLEMFLLMIERPDLMDEPAYRSLRHRLALGGEWQGLIDSWFNRHTVDEIMEQAAALRIPVAPLHDAASVTADRHLVERDVFVTDEHGMLKPRPPYRLNGAALTSGRLAPTLGADSSSVAPRAERERPATEYDDTLLPLRGVKVLDLTAWWVGGLATHTLALLGAEVIHVEGVAHPDGMRLTGSTIAKTPTWWEWGHMFIAANTNKRGITLDLGSEEGMAILHRLIGWADVFVDNFTPRVADAWGLDFESVHAINPNLVRERMPAYGLTGPRRDAPAFAQTIEPMSGMAAITGDPEGRPMSKGGLPDPVAAAHGTWAALVGLAERERTGTGVAIESVMVEASLNVTAQPIVERSAYGTVMPRLGNRSPHAAPQGVYRALGQDRWVAISVTDDAQWRALAHVLEDDTLADDPRFITSVDRHHHHDILDVIISAWTSNVDGDSAAARLRGEGVPAATCNDPRLLPDHPQYRARGLYRSFVVPAVGEYSAPGLPYRYGGIDQWVTTPSPTFGQHNREVLVDIVGLDDAVVDDMFERGQIATRPKGL